jgi:SAM-dependent methyltransferase
MDPEVGTAIVEESLSRPEIHVDWESAYRTAGHERVTDLAFERGLEAVGAPADAQWLDAGCGPAFHSIRLARHGYRVKGLDLSEQVLETARRNITEAGLSDRIEVSAGNLLELPLGDRDVGYILCWGVLMHVPDIEAAVGELARVLRPGGKIMISENNLASWENLLLGVTDRFAARNARRCRTQAGVERWFDTPGGTLLTRQCDQDWLAREFERHGVLRIARLPGLLTGLYTKLPPAPGNVLHGLNAFWLKSGRAGPAHGNLAIFERPCE